MLPPLAVACLAAAVLTTLPAQAPSPKKLARRMVTMLELPARRVEAADTLMRLGPAAVPELVRVLNDPRPDLVIRVLHILGALGGPGAAHRLRLEELAKTRDQAVRHAAEWAMHQIEPLGLTVIAEYSGNCITEIDRAGKVTTIPNLRGVFDAERLPNGRYLVVQYADNLIREIDRKGKEFWVYKKATQPLDADRLPNGNTLIVERAGAVQVIEVDPGGKIVWKHKRKNAAPQEADRLPNGNTLISYFKEGLVIEVDRKGRVVWELDGLGRISDADRLANGNTLVALHVGRTVREVDPQGKTVVEFKLPGPGGDAYRLPDGNTLVAHQSGVSEFDRQGKVVWKRAARYACRIHRY